MAPLCSSGSVAGSAGHRYDEHRERNVTRHVLGERSVLKLGIGDRIELSEQQYERLYQAFMTELKARFV